jgi:hypothetical protein
MIITHESENSSRAPDLDVMGNAIVPLETRERRGSAA